MKRNLLVAVAVVLGVTIVLFLLPGGEGNGPPTPTATTPGDAPTAAKGVPLSGRLPAAVAEDSAAPKATPELTPRQKRAMHRLIQTYQQAQRMVGDVDSSEAVKKEQETERYGTDAGGIKAAINSKIPEVKECYESWLGLNPELEGRIVTNFAIEAQEDTEGAGVVGVNLRDGGLGNKFLEGCVLSSLSDLQFEVPADGGRIEVNYPFVFKAAADPEEE